MKLNDQSIKELYVDIQEGYIEDRNKHFQAFIRHHIYEYVEDIDDIGSLSVVDFLENIQEEFEFDDIETYSDKKLSEELGDIEEEKRELDHERKLNEN